MNSEKGRRFSYSNLSFLLQEVGFSLRHDDFSSNRRKKAFRSMTEKKKKAFFLWVCVWQGWPVTKKRPFRYFLLIACVWGGKGEEGLHGTWWPIIGHVSGAEIVALWGVAEDFRNELNSVSRTEKKKSTGTACLVTQFLNPEIYFRTG